MIKVFMLVITMQLGNGGLATMTYKLDGEAACNNARVAFLDAAEREGLTNDITAECVELK